MNIGGSIVRAIRETKTFKKDEEFPRQPDIVISGTGSGDEKEWDKLVSSQKKRELSDAIRSIRLVVIEVKHTWLTPRDKKKYDNLIKGVASYNKRSKKRLLGRHRFVIVSSHSKAAVDRITIKKDRNAEEQRWYEYFDSEYDGVKHLTLEKIYEEIQNSATWCNECPILRLFEYYLALHLGIFCDIDFHKEYWRQIIDSSASAFDLKWNIADHINWLASNASVKTARDKENKWHEDKARTLKKIEFTPHERYGRIVRFEYNQKRSRKELDIVLDGNINSLDTGKIKLSGNTGDVIKILEKVVDFIRT